jgi:hypothetical protein
MIGSRRAKSAIFGFFVNGVGNGGLALMYSTFRMFFSYHSLSWN